MNLCIWGASTLKGFTDSIRSGFFDTGVETVNQDQADFMLVQIHGSPASRSEDEQIIKDVRTSKTPKFFLIHRPDEALTNPFIRQYFEKTPKAKLIFLGDLIFRFPFWADRRAYSSIFPHPYLDLSLPTPAKKPIVGSFTSWGEMRDIKHYFSIVEHLKDTDAFEFRVGGSGLDEIRIPGHVQHVVEPFVPHFNVQLYHLHGKKRYGESSGSLHRGISIPIIFEANGAERLEGIRTIKVQADDDLKLIEFENAAAEILKLATQGINLALDQNRKAAQSNTVLTFAQSVKTLMALQTSST